MPDRSDFQNLSNIERIKRWHLVVKACDELAEDFNKVLDHELLPNIMESF